MGMVKQSVKMSSKNDSFLLQWKDIDVSLSKVLNDIREESDFCDTVLVCSDSTERYLQAHKVIIASFSPILKNLLKIQNGYKSPCTSTIFLKGIPFKELSLLLDFMYKGEVRISEYQ